jgi:uncharacterized protein YjiS (DUF1127 family)
MTDVAIHANEVRAGGRLRELVPAISRALQRAAVAARTRRALEDLPDELLVDVGLTRTDIGFVAGTLARGERDATRDPQHQLNRSVTPACNGSARNCQNCAVCARYRK